MENRKLSAGFATRLLKGLGSTALGQIISAAGPIILVPFFIHAWGSNGYGQWISLTALVSFLQLLDFGGQSFFGNLLAQDYISGTEDNFKQTLSEGLSLFILICGAAFCILVIFLIIPGVFALWKNQFLGLNERLIIFFMGTIFLISIPGGIFVTAYRATGNYVRGTMVGNINRSIILLCSVGMLAGSVPPTIFAGGYLSLGVMNALIVIRDLRQRIPQCRGIRINLITAWAGRVHLKGALHFWLLALAQGLNYQGLILIIGVFNFPAAVAGYATHKTVSGLVGYVGNLLNAPLWPELTFLHAQEEKDKLRRISLLSIKMVVLLSGSAALVLWVFFPMLYPLWTGRQLQIEPMLMVILLVQAVLMAGWNTSAWPLIATNHHRPLALASLGNALLTVVLAAGLAPRYSVLGVAAASLAGDMIFGAAVYPGLLSRFLGLPVRVVYQAMVLPLACLTIPGLILIWAATYLGGWQLMLLVGLVALFFAYPAILLALGKGDVEWLRLRIQGWVQGRA